VFRTRHQRHFGAIFAVAAVFLTWDAGRLSDDTMVAYFRIRALAAGVVAGIVAFVGLFVVRNDARVTVSQAAAPPGTIKAVLVATGLAVLLIVPASSCCTHSTKRACCRAKTWKRTQSRQPGHVRLTGRSKESGGGQLPSCPGV
jgi:hypothetical protein